MGVTTALAFGTAREDGLAEGAGAVVDAILLVDDPRGAAVLGGGGKVGVDLEDAVGGGELRPLDGGDADLVAGVLRPLGELGLRGRGVGLCDQGLDKFLARAVAVAGLEERVAPVAVGGLAVGIDGNGAGEPHARGGLVFHAEEGVAGVEGGVVPGGIKGRGLGVEFGCVGPVGFSEGGFGLLKEGLGCRGAVVGVAGGERDAGNDGANVGLGVGIEGGADVGAVVAEGLCALEFGDAGEVDLHPLVRVGEGGFLGEEARGIALCEDGDGGVLAG